MKNVVNLEVTLEEVKYNESQLIKKFLRKLSKMKFMKEVRKKQYFTSNNAKRRKKEKEAAYIRKLNEENENEFDI